jgi:5'-nucleotidase
VGNDRLRILISNDDGLDSIGLTELATVLAPWCEVTVVVPDGQRSASSHAVTLHKPLRLYQVEDVAPDVPTYTCSGSPTDSVLLGVDVVLKDNRPDLVLSGINKGGNTAEDVSYSGTVAAAIEGAMYRIPSVAISLEGPDEKHFHVAALATLSLVARIGRGLGKPLSEKALASVPTKLRVPGPNDERAGWPFLLLNVNVPDLPESEIKGWMATSLGRRDYKDVVLPRNDPRGKPYYWIAGDEVVADDPPGSDLRSVREGYISATPLLLDYTDRSALRLLRGAFGAAGETDDETMEFATGRLTREQAGLVLGHIPADLTYVDERDEIAFYAEKREYIFPREPGILGRGIRNCHTEKSADDLEKVIAELRAGRRGFFETWGEREGKFLYTKYIAVRDGLGRYRGILEVVQDATRVRSLKGESKEI